MRPVRRGDSPITGDFDVDKKIAVTNDVNGRQVAIDRVSQRMQAWATAEETRVDVTANPGNPAVQGLAINLARATGFFSIWMLVFANDPEMRKRLIDAFEGTRDSGCFDAVTSRPITPAPNSDGLTGGGKI